MHGKLLKSTCLNVVTSDEGSETRRLHEIDRIVFSFSRNEGKMRRMPKAFLADPRRDARTDVRQRRLPNDDSGLSLFN